MSGGVHVPQLACELSIFHLVAVTQDGIDVGAKRVSIRRRRHARVVEVHVHLAEKRMEPVIHRCHRCIGGEVGADSSNHLSSNEQVCVGKIEVGISCSRYHEFYWTPRVERCQRLVFYPATVFYTRLRRWNGERSSSLFTPSHGCRCTNAILRKHVCSLSSFDGSDTAMRCGSFYTLHSFTGRWWCVEEALHQISAGSRCSSFCRLLDVLTSHEIASNLCSNHQRTLPQSDSTSSDQRGNRSEETAEQTSKPVPPLDTSAGKLGQCPTHLHRIVVVVITLFGDHVSLRLHREFSLKFNLSN